VNIGFNLYVCLVDEPTDFLFLLLFWGLLSRIVFKNTFCGRVEKILDDG